MVFRSFYGALDVKIMDRLVWETRIQWCRRSFYIELDVKIMERLVWEARIQGWADPSTEHWMSR